MDSSTSTPSTTPEGNNYASKTARKAKYISLALVVALVAAIGICAYQLHRVHIKLEQAEKEIETLTNATGPRCYFIDENNVRLMTVEAAQKEFDAYIDSQGNLLTIFTILITVMVALLGVGAPIFINREQGNANKEKIGEEVQKQEEILKERLNTETEEKIKEAKKQIDEKITEIGTDAKSKSEKMGAEMESAKRRIEKIERDVTGIIEDLRKRQENFDKNREIENKSPDEQVKEWKKMEEEGRADSDTYFKLGKHYFDKKDYVSASHYFGEAVKNRENYAEVYPLWAKALEKQGQLAKAWEKIGKAIILNPKDNKLKNKQESLLKRILTPESPLKETETIEVGGVKYDMKLVRKGVFTMGSTPEQGDDSWDDEIPAHEVLFSTDYYIGETVVTQALWKTVMGDNPSNFKGNDSPVECVSWNEVTGKFIPRLNRMTGRKFRLPTEAEWEFAARGGNKSKRYKYSGSDIFDEVAWCWKNSGDRYLEMMDDDLSPSRIRENNGRTHPVKIKKPNELGLFDMSGNVFEWCQDWFGDYNGAPQVNPTGPESGQDRVCRGGCWHAFVRSSRVACRFNNDPEIRNDFIGFRLALSPSLP